MKLHIKGACENNLKNVDAEFDSGLTVVTGVSGSGKSSLVFDTLHREAQRRFQEMFTLGASRERLTPADVEDITGLHPTVAVGQNLLNRNPNSTVATASGLHPLLRLLYARFGTRHCPECGSPVNIYDQDSLVEVIRQLDGPIQVSVPLVRRVAGSHRTLLRLLDSTFRRSQLEVDGQTWRNIPLAPNQPHSIEVILAKFQEKPSPSAVREALEDSAMMGANAVHIANTETSSFFSTAPVCAECSTWLPDLEPQHFNRHCPDCEGAGCDRCQGTGMTPAAAATTVHSLRLDQLLAQSVKRIHDDFPHILLPIGAERLYNEITSRLDALASVGLGYVALDRPAPTLSRGEAQRLRLAVLLTGRLSDLLHLLDEPTIGQHPQDIAQLMTALAELSGPVIYIEHDRIAAACANAVLDLGPGAGTQGGEIVFSGTPTALWHASTPSGRFFSGRETCTLPEPRDQPDRFFTIHGAHQHNLQDMDVRLALGRINVICGVSGSGKSTLVEDVLYASMHGGKPIGCAGLDVIDLKAELIDQSPIGRNPRSNPATYTKLLDIIRVCYAANTGLDPTCFSFNTSEGACPVCKGMGAVEVKMRYLPSTWITCTECEGARFTDQVLDARVTFGDEHAYSIADFLNLTVAEAVPLLQSAPGLSERRQEDAERILSALQDIGLDYLQLGQPSPTLSGGEAQRVKLAKHLGRRGLKGKILILDEPSTGLHPADIHGLLVVLDRLARAGGTIVLVEHNLDIIRAADWVVELGPGAGPAGGQLLFSGPFAALIREANTPTSTALLEESDLEPHPLRSTSGQAPSNLIRIQGARANNLRNLHVDIPKNALTVVTGISGSGKSSLVRDVIEREAQRRYLESLSMYERQSFHESQQAEVEDIQGMGVTLSIDTQRGRYDPRAHLGDDTEILGGLAVLFAHQGTLNCPQCHTAMSMDGKYNHCPACNHSLPLPKPRHFSPTTYSAACQTCHGVGTLQEPRPNKLIIHPDKPLCDGAMYSPGFFPNGFLCKPFNSGYDIVQAFAARFGFDPATTPWNEISPEAQQAFLFGDPQPLEVTFTSRTGNVTTRKTDFHGFYGWIRDWDLGGTYTETVTCPDCGGAGLREPYRSVRLAGRTIFELRRMPLSRLHSVIQNLAQPVPPHPIVSPELEKVAARLSYLCKVGLGYLNLDRYSATLSAGEAQRVKLARLLDGRLSGMTLLLDEPTRGLHPAEVDALTEALRDLRDIGNTVIVVEHDLQIIRAANHLVDMGPNAGRFGGQVVAQGTPQDVAKADSHTARWLSGEARFTFVRSRRQPTGWLKLHQPSGYNLKVDVLEVPMGLLVGVCGVSGSGKSTLIQDTLGRILAPVKQTTSVAYEPVDPEPYHHLEGEPPRTLIIDQTRAGLHNPASFLGIEKALRKAFARSEMAVSLKLDEQSLKKGCTACGGRGVQRIDMGFLPDIFETCEVCHGSGYPPEASAVQLFDHSLPEVMAMPIEQAYQIFRDNETIAPLLKAPRQVGLGYLILNQPGRTLSGGEAQRLKIAKELGKASREGTLYILDEPTVGQHLEDIRRLVRVLQGLVSAGGSVLVVEHHPHVLAACDWLIELGPGGGPEGGQIVAAGEPRTIASLETPTAPYLEQILGAAQ